MGRRVGLLLSAVALLGSRLQSVEAVPSLIGINYYILQATGTDLCLTADENDVTAPVHIKKCVGSDLQLWQQDKGDDFKNQYINRATRTCLTGKLWHPLRYLSKSSRA